MSTSSLCFIKFAFINNLCILVGIMEWVRRKFNRVDGISCGDYRVDKDGDNSYTAYKMNPYLCLGRNIKSAKEAMQLCFDHLHPLQASAEPLSLKQRGSTPRTGSNMS
jgi:hypothetical protein